MVDTPIEDKQKISFTDKIINFYKSNRILAISIIIIPVISFAITGFYLKKEESKREYIAERFLEAKINLNKENKDGARKILNEIIYSNERTYSPLSLFLIINENLFQNDQELVDLFDHILNNIKMEKEIRNLIIFKKSLIYSDFSDEANLLKSLNPILKEDSFWKPHALLLLGDYFVSKGEFLKAKEAYIKIFSVKNLSSEFNQTVQLRLTSIISNE